jgi:hypothetical protein
MLPSFNGQCDVNSYPWSPTGPSQMVADWNFNTNDILSSPPVDWFSIPAYANETATGNFISEANQKCPLLVRTADYMPLQWIRTCRVPRTATLNSILNAYTAANVMNPSDMYNCPAGNNPFTQSSTDGSLFIPTPYLVGHGANAHFECGSTTQAYLPGEIFPIPAFHPYDLEYTCPIGTDSVISVCIGGTPTYLPTGVPTSEPTSEPTLMPTSEPTTMPSAVPSCPQSCGCGCGCGNSQSLEGVPALPFGSCCENEDFQIITKTESNVTISTATTSTVTVVFEK